MATPNEGYPTWAEDNLIEVIDGKTFATRLAPPAEVKQSGLKFQQPAARSWFNYQLYLINKWIEELDSRTSGVTPKTGWIKYSDTTYTDVSPLTVTAGSEVDLPNNAGSIVNSSGPLGAVFYDGSQITPDNDGDSYTLSVRFKVDPTSAGSGVIVSLDIGDGSPDILVADSRSLVDGTNTQQITMDFTYDTLNDFVTNGGTLKVKAIGSNLDIFDINYFIQRTYYKDNS